MSWLLVATGGALGSCMRYGLSLCTVAMVGDGRSVLGTFFANVPLALGWW